MLMPNLGRVRLVACHDQADSATLRTALDPIGIKNLQACHDIESMASLLEDGLVDLMLYDYDMTGDKFLEMTQKIRCKSRGA